MNISILWHFVFLHLSGSIALVTQLHLSDSLSVRLQFLTLFLPDENYFTEKFKSIKFRDKLKDYVFLHALRKFSLLR